jgi:hypothetical protein
MSPQGMANRKGSATPARGAERPPPGVAGHQLAQARAAALVVAVF